MLEEIHNLVIHCNVPAMLVVISGVLFRPGVSIVVEIFMCCFDRLVEQLYEIELIADWTAVVRIFEWLRPETVRRVPVYWVVLVDSFKVPLNQPKKIDIKAKTGIRQTWTAQVGVVVEDIDRVTNERIHGDATGFVETGKCTQNVSQRFLRRAKLVKVRTAPCVPCVRDALSNLLSLSNLLAVLV